MLSDPCFAMFFTSAMTCPPGSRGVMYKILVVHQTVSNINSTNLTVGRRDYFSSHFKQVENPVDRCMLDINVTPSTFRERREPPRQGVLSLLEPLFFIGKTGGKKIFGDHNSSSSSPKDLVAPVSPANHASVSAKRPQLEKPQNCGSSRSPSS